VPVTLKYSYKLIILLCLFAATGFLSYSLTVTRAVPDQKTVDLATIPAQIGAWQMTSQKLHIQQFEKSFLNDVLFRIYERPDGKAVALAIAYGADQRQNFSIHAPEGCYRAEGFNVTTMGLARLGVPDVQLKQMFAQKEKVTETIQYWIVLNGKVVTNHFERKLKQLYYSLLGARAGGVLVRISSLTPPQNSAQDFDMQKEFILALYGALNGEQRTLLFGGLP
jgi:EpsI family protein